MKKSIIIFSNELKRAETRMFELIHELGEDIINVKGDKKNINIVETELSLFRAVKWELNRKGMRADEVHIDFDAIDSEEIWECILPLLNVCKNWKEAVYYF